MLEEDLELNLNNLKIIKFNTFIDKRMNNAVYASWQHVKWMAAIDCLKRFELDNLMYVDTDTIFQKDPSYFFKKYGNSDYIYGRNDVVDEYTSILNVDGRGMNDGIFILSKTTIPYLKNLVSARSDYVYNAQERFKDSNSFLQTDWMAQWLSGQHGVFEYLKKINKPLKTIDNDDIYEVVSYDKYKNLTEEEKNKYAIIHYFNFNAMYFCPQSFKKSQIAHFKAEVGGIN